MKQLFNYSNGRALNVSFTDDSTDLKILQWTKDNVEDLEELSIGDDLEDCDVLFHDGDRLIQIRGSFTLVFIEK